MDPLWSETCWSTFKYFIILIIYTYYILCISWIIKCFIITDARRKHEDIQTVNIIFIGPCIIVIFENKRPTWCHLLFYFTSYVLNMFRTLIYPSSRAYDYSVELPHWSACSWFDVCWSFGVVRLEWYPCCRPQPATQIPLQPNHTETPTHIEPRTHRPMW